jgi:hypothetical protein
LKANATASTASAAPRHSDAVGLESAWFDTGRPRYPRRAVA